MSEKWIRICPICFVQIEHTTKKIRNSSEKKKTPCFRCKLKLQKGQKIEKLRCPFCNFECCHTDGFADHLSNTHQTTILETYIRFICGGKIPICPANCGKPLTFNGWKKGFSSIHSECYDEKLIKTSKEIEEINKKRSVAHTGTVGWAKDLTKENDERILKRAELTKIGIQEAKKNGTWSEPWSKGKTKETDPRLEALSKRIIEDYYTGKRIQWSKNLTKETDERLAIKAKNFSDKCKTGEIIPWHKGITVANDERLYKKGQERRGKPAVPPFTKEKIIERTSKYTNIKLIEESLSVYKNQNTPLLFECVFCKKKNRLSLSQSYGDKCRFCRPNISKHQQEIFDFVKTAIENVDEIIMNDRKAISPKEIDVFIPSKNFAIEVNGIYWHSSAFKEKNFHALKTENAKNKGIEMIQIFEDEWNFKNEIVKSFILEKLDKTPEIISLEDCTISQVGLKERKAFFEKNHLEGYILDDNGIGLYKNEELVACISLKIQNQEFCEIRYCNKIFSSVKNGFVILTNEAVGWSISRDIKHILYVHDERFGKLNNVSPNTNFTKLDPRFYWTNYKNRFSKEEISEEEANKLEFSKIWGCNMLIYEIV